MSGVDPDIPLPTMEELIVPELTLTTPALKAGAHHLGKFCDEPSKEFMLCNSEEKDPRKCLKEGEEVTSCGFKFFHLVKSNCMESFTKYWQCVDHAREEMDLTLCRATQSVYDKCVFEKFGWERPPYGHFARTRLHETARKKPEQVNPPVPEWIPGPTRELTEKALKENKRVFTHYQQ